jgi:hypothetical protein
VQRVDIGYDLTKGAITAAAKDDVYTLVDDMSGDELPLVQRLGDVEG